MSCDDLGIQGGLVMEEVVVKSVPYMREQLGGLQEDPEVEGGGRVAHNELMGGNLDVQGSSWCIKVFLLAGGNPLCPLPLLWVLL